MRNKIIALIISLTVVCVLNADLQAQEKIVSGVVTDTLNTLLPGVSVLMMEETAGLPYYTDEHLQCVELPYGNGAFSTIAFLPYI